MLFEFCPFREVALIVQKVLTRSFVPDHYEGCADNQSDSSNDQLIGLQL